MSGRQSYWLALTFLLSRNDAQGSLEVPVAQVPVSSVGFWLRCRSISPTLSRSGKTSGRMKTEKRLQKIEEERKRMSMAMSDTPSGMIDAFNRRQEKTGEAFMTLSVGNRS